MIQKKLKYISKKKGNALILVLFTMFLLATMSIFFISSSTLEMKISTTYSDMTNASIVADAGMDYAIGKLKETFSSSITKVGRSSWWFQKHLEFDEIAKTIQANTNIGDEYDDSAAGLSIEKLESHVETSPSYKLENKEENNYTVRNNISGFLPRIITQSNPSVSNQNVDLQTYTLKILDTTSQFPLNSHVTQSQMNEALNFVHPANSFDEQYKDSTATILGNMLDILSREVAKLQHYQDSDQYDIQGPFHGLGKEIIKKRNELQGFSSKYQLIGEYGDKSISQEDVLFMWDYITVYPQWKEMYENTIYRNIAPIQNHTEDSYRIEYRVPVNINTASYPVLIALLEGLSIADPLTTLTEGNAKTVATAILSYRHKYNFESWHDFYQYIDTLKKTGALEEYKCALIKSNFDPNVHLKKGNPDAPIFQLVTKTQFYHYSTEFCFYPLGKFEITSLGQIWDVQNNVVASSKKNSVVSIFDTLYHTSQYDFEGGPDGFLAENGDYQHVPDSENLIVYDPKKPELREKGNPQIFKQDPDIANPDYGEGLHAFSSGNNTQKSYSSVRQLWDDTSKIFGHIVPIVNKESIFVQTGTAIQEPNYLFTLSCSSLNNTIEHLSEAQQKLAYPSPNFTTGDCNNIGGNLYSDGFLLDESTSHLPYEITSQNFPDMDEPGLVHFWFKISQNFSEHDWKTVFFSNQTKSQGDNGIQREIQFKISKPSTTSQDRFLRRLQIRYRNILFGNITENFITDTLKLVLPVQNNNQGTPGENTGSSENTENTESSENTGSSENTENTGSSENT
ncbi:MAG TPA: hypothetical protein PLG16_07210, partial [Planctomycetota bacterium]|nr:hypothetical protein [Planctomycetota bacterium]